jgi:DNA repair exonuclease SbcCD nuclease subunit
VGDRGRVLIKFVAVMNETHAARRLGGIDQSAFTHLHRQRNQKRKGESKVEIKGKVFPVHAIKEYRGSRGIAPLILKLGTWWM